MDKERNKDKKKIDSEDDRSSVGSVNGKILDFWQQKIILAVPFYIRVINSMQNRYIFMHFSEFDFDEDDTTLGIDLGKDKVLMEPAKRKEKKEPEKVFYSYLFIFLIYF